MTTETRTVAEIEREIEERTVRADEMQQELNRLGADIVTAEEEHARLYAAGKDPAALEDTLNGLERQERGLSRGLEMLRGEIAALREERTALLKVERQAAWKEAVEHTARRMDTLATALQEFAEGEFAEHWHALQDAIDATGAAQRAAGQVGVGPAPFERPIEHLWTKHAPLLIVAQDLLAFRERRPIYRNAAPGGATTVTTRSAGGTESVTTGEPVPDRPLAFR